MTIRFLIFGLCMILLVVGMVSATEYYFNDTSHGGSSTSSTCNATSPCSDLSQLTSTPDYNSHVNFAYGNTFRGDYIYAGRNNVSYNSYGDSSLGKPKIKGSIYLNSSNTSCFYNISSTLWKLNTTCLTLPSDPQTMYYNTTGDVGTLIMLRDTTSDTTPSTEWEYYYNVTNKSVTIKTNGSNPLSYGNGIEIPRYNYSDSAYSSFMFIDQDDNVNVTGLSFYYLREGGIRIYDGNNVRITGNEFHFAYNKVMTISQGADNVIIDGNNFTDVGIRGMDEPYGQEAQGEIIFASESGIRNTTITNNKILRGAGVPINIVRTAGWTIVQNNSITNCTTSGLGTGNDWSAGIYFDGADNGIISYNNITNCHIGIHIGNEIAGTIAENNNITHNIISRNKISDIIIDCNAGTNGYCTNNTRVLQNTLYKNSNVTGSGYGHQTFYANATYLYVKDNIIFNNYTSTTEGDLIIYKNDTLMTNINMSYNDYNSTSGRNVYNKNTGTYTSLTSWQTAMGQEANSITNNPLFTDAANLDFRPIAGSAVCNASSNGSYIGAIPCSEADNSTSNESNETVVLSGGSGVFEVVTLSQLVSEYGPVWYVRIGQFIKNNFEKCLILCIIGFFVFEFADYSEKRELRRFRRSVGVRRW